MRAAFSSARGKFETMPLVRATADDDGEVVGGGAGGWNRANNATPNSTNPRTDPSRTRGTTTVVPRISIRSPPRLAAFIYKPSWQNTINQSLGIRGNAIEMAIGKSRTEAPPQATSSIRKSGRLAPFKACIPESQNFGVRKLAGSRISTLLSATPGNQCPDSISARNPPYKALGERLINRPLSLRSLRLLMIVGL